MNFSQFETCRFEAERKIAKKGGKKGGCKKRVFSGKDSDKAIKLDADNARSGKGQNYFCAFALFSLFLSPLR